MLTQFRHHYPQGSLISELIDIDRGLYLVKVSVEVEGVVLATGLAGENTIELAEDAARERAIAALVLDKGDTETRRQGGQGDKGDWETGRLGDKEEKLISPVVKTQPQPKVQPPSPIPEPIPQPVAAAVASENSKSKATNNIPTEVITEPETSPLETQEYQRNIFDQPIVEDTPPPEPVSSVETKTESSAPVPIDFNEVMHKIDLEMKRLKWTKEQGRDYLLSTYGKRARVHLQDNELLEFLNYLENLPS
ncbi:MAG: hypothetical protein QNJ18_18990 [Xenococcaceae cyanobacterium MO_167.B52]|nr:hypothetical protein [Xenococcaceae cyanobacterium MO_167.B52]